LLDLKSTLFLTVQGKVEADNRKNTLDFKSRSILTSLKNREKTVAELLERSYVDNKEALALLESLVRKGLITLDKARSVSSSQAQAQAVPPTRSGREIASSRNAIGESVGASAVPNSVTTRISSSAHRVPPSVTTRVPTTRDTPRQTDEVGTAPVALVGRSNAPSSADRFAEQSKSTSVHENTSSERREEHNSRTDGNDESRVGGIVRAHLHDVDSLGSDNHPTDESSGDSQAASIGQGDAGQIAALGEGRDQVDTANEIPTVEELTNTDSIDIIHETQSSVAPKVGRLRPMLGFFLPNTNKTEDSSDTPNESESVEDLAPESTTEHGRESINTTVTAKPRINLEPVRSKTPPVKPTISLIQPAIPATKTTNSGGFLSGGGAGKNFLSTFGGSQPSSPTLGQPGKGPQKGKSALRTVSVHDGRALTINESVAVSEAVFVLSDFCIDHLSSDASGYIEQFERCRDVRSLQEVVATIAGQIKPQEKDKRMALFAAIEKVNAVT
jgi:hypothetical protein